LLSRTHVVEIHLPSLEADPNAVRQRHRDTAAIFSVAECSVIPEPTSNVAPKCFRRRMSQSDQLEAYLNQSLSKELPSLTSDRPPRV
jgi:hypothetical protein